MCIAFWDGLFKAVTFWVMRCVIVTRHAGHKERPPQTAVFAKSVTEFSRRALLYINKVT